MSDVQIVTGFSILISGFLQLRCGLTTFYWQVIVYLAWFSSLTHLSCLTLLRNHLHNHAAERRLRLFAMGGLATLLVVGLSFTGNYYWEVDASIPRPRLEDLAMCYLPYTPRLNLTLWTMVVSTLIIVFAFASRVIKLHRALSIDIFGRARAQLSKQARKILHFVYVRCDIPGSAASLRRALGYRPLLATYLVVRFLLDGWSSLLLEASALT